MNSIALQSRIRKGELEMKVPVARLLDHPKHLLPCGQTAINHLPSSSLCQSEDAGSEAGVDSISKRTILDWHKPDQTPSTHLSIPCSFLPRPADGSKYWLN